MAFDGSFGFFNWGISSWDMIMKFGTQVKEVKWGPRNFSWVRIISGGFSMGLSKILWLLGSERLGHPWYRLKVFCSFLWKRRKVLLFCIRFKIVKLIDARRYNIWSNLAVLLILHFLNELKLYVSSWSLLNHNSSNLFI